MALSFLTPWHALDCPAGSGGGRPNIPAGAIDAAFQRWVSREWLCHRWARIHPEPNFGGGCSMSILKRAFWRLGTVAQAAGARSDQAFRFGRPSHFLGSASVAAMFSAPNRAQTWDTRCHARLIRAGSTQPNDDLVDR